MSNKTISNVFTILSILAMAAPITFTSFAVFRICHIITWSWWIITLPLWGTALFIVSAIIVLVFFMFASRSVITYGKSKKGGRK